MNLAIVSPYPPEITGIGQYGYHLSQSLAQTGQFERIFVLAGSRAAPPAGSLDPRLRVEYTWQPDTPGVGRGIVANLQRQNPDLVWFNLGVSVFGRSPLANLVGFLSLLRVQLSGLPTVVTLHELVELADLRTLRAPGGRLARWGARLLTKIVVRADVVCLTMHRHVRWFTAYKPDLVCLHIPLGAYHPPSRLPEAGAPELLFFSTLAPYKGIEVLLSAYEALISEQPDLHLTIAGAEHPRFPNYRRRLMQMYAGLTGVRWLGQVSEEHVSRLFAGAQLVILPYLASTGSSSVIHQAAMWGRAVVASDIPEIATLVDESGLRVAFFPNRDPEGLASAIRSMLASPERRQAMITHNFAAISRRAPEFTCQAYLQAFNLAFEARQSPKRLALPAKYPSELA